MDEDLDQYFDNGVNKNVRFFKVNFLKRCYQDEADFSEDDDDEGVLDNIDPNYELDREEPTGKSSTEFAKFLISCEYPEDIIQYLKSLKLFEKDAKTGDVVPTKSLKYTITGFCQYLLGGKRIQRPVLRGIAKIFGKHDIFHYISQELTKLIIVSSSKIF